MNPLHGSQPHSKVGAAAGAILVVDDERDIRLLVARILREQGYTVVTASNGEEALSQMAPLPVSLIVCNLRMPRVGGHELYACLARVCPPLAAQFVFCSGDTVSRETREQLQETGRPWLQKPFDIDDLMHVVAEQAGGPIHLPRRAYEQALAFLDQRAERNRRYGNACAVAGI